MRHNFLRLLPIAVPVVLGGCVTPPALRDGFNGSSGPPVESILAAIRCELLEAIANHPELVTDGAPGGPTIPDPQNPAKTKPNPDKGKIPGWTASLQLTIQVDETSGLTPSVASIMPYTAPVSNMTLNASATLSTAAQRIYGEAFTTNLRNLATNLDNDRGLKVALDHGQPIKDAKHPELDPLRLKMQNLTRKNVVARSTVYSCQQEVATKFGLSGRLGIPEIVDIGFGSAKYTKGDFTEVKSTANGNTYGAFGESMQFVLTRNVSGVGPTWTLSHFKGPAASAGFFGAGRVETNKLFVSFAPPSDPSAKSPVAGSAAARANDLNSRFQILTIPGLQAPQ